MARFTTTSTINARVSAVKGGDKVYLVDGSNVG